MKLIAGASSPVNIAPVKIALGILSLLFFLVLTSCGGPAGHSGQPNPQPQPITSPTPQTPGITVLSGKA